MHFPLSQTCDHNSPPWHTSGHFILAHGSLLHPDKRNTQQIVTIKTTEVFSLDIMYYYFIFLYIRIWKKIGKIWKRKDFPYDSGLKIRAGLDQRECQIL